MAKVMVVCKNGIAMPMGNGTNQEIRVRSLYPLASADIAELSGAFEIQIIQGKIRKSPEHISQTFELGFGLDARKNLLAYRAKQLDSGFLNKIAKLNYSRVIFRLIVPEGQ